MKNCPGPDRHPKAPQFRMPPGACDCHAHVFGPESIFPFSPERSYTPPDSTVDDYMQLLATLRIDRAVIVHGGAHGTDNRVTFNALKVLGDRARAIAVMPAGSPEAELERMHELGFRGYRMSTVVSGGVGFDQLEALGAEAGRMGWHLLLHFNRSSELVDLMPRLLDQPAPLVLDHMARIRAEEGINGMAFRAMATLLDTGRVWVKLASLYRLSDEPHPFNDMLPMIHEVARRWPERILWGSNWPHPICSVSMSNDGDLVDLIPLWVPDAETQHRMLVDNPASLYGF